MDKNHFGSSPAAEKLAEMLTEPHIQRRVVAFMIKYGKRLNACEDIKNQEVKKYVVQLIYQQNKKNISNLRVPEQIKNYMANVCQVLYSKHYEKH